jgi:hypothetical protein
LRDEAYKAHLAPLTKAYADWIAKQRAILKNPDLQPFAGVAQLALENSQRTLERIQAGIELLSDPMAAQAFRFANRAMYLQRIHLSRSPPIRSRQNKL